MNREWTADEILSLARTYQPAVVLAAAADWDVFGLLSDSPMTALSVARQLNSNGRAMTVLLDALTALKLLAKHKDTYHVPPSVSKLLTENSVGSILPMVRHQANCMRRWIQLSQVIQSGGPAERVPSIRGEAADQSAFIGAMHNICEPTADHLVHELGPPLFRHLLDIGGASGTWTLAFLRTNQAATATLFDLPHVIPMARKRIVEAGLIDRVTLVAGDFYTDFLPPHADLAWLSAIAHQNSREQNRALFGKIHTALTTGGTLLIRDIVMDESHTAPAGGALFAINMLVGTESGGTFTFSEFREDLERAGFTNVKLLRSDEWMNSII